MQRAMRITAPADTIREALDRAKGSQIAARLTDALDTLGPRTGSLAEWMASMDGRTVDTVQVTAFGAWAPLGRVVNASRATYVTLGGSRRDYRGTRVVGVSDRAILVELTDGGETGAVLYVDAGPA